MRPTQKFFIFFVFLSLLALVVSSIVSVSPVRAAPLASTPPYSGTVFIDPDIITAADPTAFLSVAYTGQGSRSMFDRRVAKWVTVNAYLFNASYSDGLSLEVQVNPEFGSSSAAQVEAQKYARVIGQLPKALRTGIKMLWIHKGMELFGGGNDSILIHTNQAAAYGDTLEEAIIHEAAHTSLDAVHASAAQWLNAQTADAGYISTYARDNPTREDIAESFLPYLAVKYKRDRISETDKNKILQAIPNRINYFNQQSFEIYPFTPILNSSVAWTGTTDNGHSVSFIVGNSGTEVSSFALNYYVTFNPTCAGPSASGTINLAGPLSINGNGQFGGASGEASFSAHFTSANTVEGTYTIAVNYVGEYVGCSMSADGTWTAEAYNPLYAAPNGATTGTCGGWDNACDLQYALSKSGPGHQIWAKAGTYSPGTLRTDSFQLKNDVSLYGGFAGNETQLSQRNPATNATILSGDIGTTGDASDNSYHVVTGSSTDASAILDGFTITGGKGDANNGGGMLNQNGSPTLRNLIFEGNSANAGGGMFNLNANPTLENVTFKNNDAPSEGGGGIYNNASNPSLTNVTFYGNSAGGYGGGGLTNYQSNPTLTNVTFSDNNATSGGGMVNYDSQPTLKNTIIANSLGGGDCVGAVNAASANNLIKDGSNICGLSNGTNGNITGADPQLGALAFYDGFSLTLALESTSPAIDVGDNAVCPGSDQRGVARPADGNFDGTATCDMGAFEFADLVAPDTSITAMPQANTTLGTATFSFGGTDDLSGVASFECKLDAAAYSACSSPLSYTSLPVGTHTFAVRAIDKAGNADETPAVYTWVVMGERARNGGFNLYGTTKIPKYWIAKNFSLQDGKDTSYKKEGAASVKIIGASGKIKTLSQTVSISGSAKDVLTFSFWARGSSIPSTGLCQAQISFYDGALLKRTQTVVCKTGTYSSFTKKTTTFTANVSYTSVVIRFVYSKSSGTVWFDMVSLIK